MKHAAALEIFNDALDLPPPDRPAFLDRACAGNKGLRAEIDALLAAHERHPPPLFPEVPGTRPERVGRYPILETLGRGGMGTVYLAEDPELGRKVALKLLPTRLLHQPEQYARLRREAQILASLNHPNVATLHSFEEADGRPFLTMEVVRGESLAQRIAGSPSGAGLGISETLRIAVQMARALESAHAQGIIHRDLKPANVGLTPEGGVKVFDFGLAKVVGVEPETGPAMNASGRPFEVRSTVSSASPSAVSPAVPPSVSSADSPADALPVSDEPGETMPGSIMGSPGYMSPEQIRGEAAGPASDLWALGCILYECLSGWPAFPGRIRADRLVAAIETEPDWKALPGQTPARLRRLLGECLVKDPVARISSASRLRAELEQVANRAGTLSGGRAGENEGSFVSRTLGRTRGQRVVRVALIVAAGCAAVLFIVLIPLKDKRPQETLGDSRSFRQVTFTGKVNSFDLSPDDRTVAYATSPGELTLHDLDSGAERVVHRAGLLMNPHWSPDGAEIIFSALDSSGSICAYVQRADGGTARRIGPVPSTALAWTPGGREIVTYTWSFTSRIWRLVLIDRATGDTTSIPGDDQIKEFKALSYSPSGRFALLCATAQDGMVGDWITSRVGVPARRILREVPLAAAPVWSGEGDTLLFLALRNGTSELQRIAIDLGSGQPAGPPETVDRFGGAINLRAFHRGRRILYQTGNGIVTLWVLDRKQDGDWTRRSLLTGTAILHQPRLSPDARQVALLKKSGDNHTLSTLSLEDGSARTIASFESTPTWPAWSPDGTEIALSASVQGESRVWRVSVSGGAPRALSRQACFGYVYWCPDARVRYQTAAAAKANYTFVHPVSGEEDSLFHGPSRGTVFQSSVSPDGQWMAVAGNRNGTREVKVWLIHRTDLSEHLLYNQSAAPIGWSRDGSWIYLALSREEPETPGTMKARVLRTPLRGGSAEPVAELPPGDLALWSDADISSDGNRIVAVLTQYSHDLWLAEGIGSR